MNFLTPAILKGIAVAIIIGGLFAGYSMFIDRQQQIGYDKRTAEYVAQESKDLKAALLETERLINLVKEANDARKKLEEVNNAMAVRNNALLSKLRNTDAYINSLLSSASNEALRNATGTYADLFAECRIAYAEMGRAAAGHLGDVKQLEAAWPTKESE